MSIKTEYFEYLNHFRETVTVRELFENPHTSDMIALRHDVDYDLDLALEMSYWENRKGIRSTYYLLHSAEYWNDIRFIEKCLQIQNFGHEVGLHINILAEWMRGRLTDVAFELERLITRLRKAGLLLSGISSHGDHICYEKQFNNYWCFSELRPSNPVLTESGLSAEGIPAENPKYHIRYPETHQLLRQDGKVFNLWSISMKKLGIDYEANHVTCDSYYTDSGGGWYRSGNPLQHTLSIGRYQILMHPFYWRDMQKIFFFLGQ